MGGRVTKESRLKGLSAWNRVRDYRLYQMQQMPNVELFLGSEITPEIACEFGADHIFVATGSRWRDDGLGRTRYTPIPGFSGCAFTPDSILDGESLSGPIVIYDDDHSTWLMSLQNISRRKATRFTSSVLSPRLRAGWATRWNSLVSSAP